MIAGLIDMTTQFEYTHRQRLSIDRVSILDRRESVSQCRPRMEPEADGIHEGRRQPAVENGERG